MGDGDEGMKTSPRLFCASNVLGLGVPLSLLLAPCPLSLSLGRHVILSPFCLSSVGVWGGAGLPCRRAARWGLSLVALSPVSVGGAEGYLPAFLVSALSAVGEEGRFVAFCLLG